MPVISCTKFGINQAILTVFSGVRAKKSPPPPVVEKAENVVGNRVKATPDVIKAQASDPLILFFFKHDQM